MKAKTLSVIQILLTDKDDNEYGFISFEIQPTRRVWQRGELNSLTIIAKILNNFFNHM